MAITVNGRILRNLPEQVSKNTEDIINLQEQSNNQEIRITALEGNAIALATFQDCTFTGTTTFTGPLNSSDGFTFGDDGFVAGDLSVGGALSVTGSSTFTGTVTASGNENVGGDLSVTGNITNTLLNNTENILRGSQDVAGYYSNDSDITISNLPTNLECNYAHARISNGKLSIVVNLYVLENNAVSANTTPTTIGTINLPAWAADKIQPFAGNTVALGTSLMTGIYSNESPEIKMRINKGTNSVYLQLVNQAVSSEATPKNARFEFNLSL